MMLRCELVNKSLSETYVYVLGYNVLKVRSDFLLDILLYIAALGIGAVVIIINYLIIKNAVKNGVKEALSDIENDKMNKSQS